MSMQARFWRVCAMAAALCVSACASMNAAPASQTEIRRIVSTTAFGMCVGYCTTRLEISEGRAVLLREGRSGRGEVAGPDLRYEAALSPGEWEEFVRLAANTDMNALPPVIGCPDCADGGAETLTIEGDGAPESVTIEYNAHITAAQPLLDRIRALRTRLLPE